MLLKDVDVERLTVLLLLIFVAVVLVSYFAASVVRIAVALGAFSFVDSLAMVSRIQGVKVDRLVKMPANSMSSVQCPLTTL